MDLIFAGTPVFAALSLRAIVAAGHRVKLVLTQPDRPSGRGKRLQISAVKEAALDLGLGVFQPPSLRDEAVQTVLRDVRAEAMVVAAYGLILPAAVLDIPRLGCLNIHASILPRWRGAAPIQRAVQAGDAETGICIMQMDAGLDTGPVLLTKRLAIEPTQTGGQVHDRLAVLGADAIVEALAGLGSGGLAPQAQPTEGITYAHKLSREDGNIDWQRPARELVDQIRAFDPVPGCTTSIAGPEPTTLKIWAARVYQTVVGEQLSGEVPVPGTVFEAGHGRLLVASGDGLVELLSLQRPGGKRLPVAEFQRGSPIPQDAKLI